MGLRFKSRARLEAEVFLLHRQLIVLGRRLPPRAHLTNADRTAIRFWLDRLFPSHQALNLGLLFLFVQEAGLGELIAQAFATVLVTVTTFFANRAWTFRMHHAQPDQQVPAGAGDV